MLSTSTQYQCYLDEMRRHFIWYGIAFGWAIAAIAGLFLHHASQAMPAFLFAIVFFCTGIVVGRRDDAERQKRTPRFK